MAGVGRRFSVAVMWALFRLKRQRSPVVRGEVSAVLWCLMRCGGQHGCGSQGIYPDDVTK
uniref:Uncharacterized protein n=1 Tax=Klebsiella pneumoniae TaxID=573 RepID=W8QT54_KLEPN|nr:hypothetical protein [Klebsiella pneumoniae]AIT41960.1 hypothetical protein [Klebsiella pneumoniae]